tara:strand:- start:176 stop:487 length:312 start_codon:yes stop_codon:yes gene_type:complete
MIYYTSYISILLVAVVYTFLLNKLIIRNTALNYENIKSIDIPEHVLVYEEENKKITFTNIEEDLIKHVEILESDEEKTIPRHGIYKFIVKKDGERKNIVGIPI